MLLAAQQELVSDQHGRGVEGVVEFVVGDDLKRVARFDHHAVALAAKQVDMPAGAERRGVDTMATIVKRRRTAPADVPKWMNRATGLFSQSIRSEGSLSDFLSGFRPRFIARYRNKDRSSLVEWASVSAVACH